MALTQQLPLRSRPEYGPALGLPGLETAALEEMDDPFCNHDVANSDKGPSRRGTSPPRLLSQILDAHDWLPLPELQSLHLTLGPSTAGDAPSPSLSLSLEAGTHDTG